MVNLQDEVKQMLEERARADADAAQLAKDRQAANDAARAKAKAENAKQADAKAQEWQARRDAQVQNAKDTFARAYIMAGGKRENVDAAWERELERRTHETIVKPVLNVTL